MPQWHDIGKGIQTAPSLFMAFQMVNQAHIVPGFVITQMAFKPFIFFMFFLVAYKLGFAGRGEFTNLTHLYDLGMCQTVAGVLSAAESFEPTREAVILLQRPPQYFS